MYPRTNYEMTAEDLKNLLEACKPTTVMKIGNSTGSSPQENANRAWKKLGEKMGFDYRTVRPISGKGTQHFSAVPYENETQREERLGREKEEARLAKIANLKLEISKKQSELNSLEKE
jgi:hypothetical protein